MGKDANMEQDWDSAERVEGKKVETKEGGEERRIHKDDEQRRPYTWQEFKEAKMEKDWDSAERVEEKPVAHYDAPHGSNIPVYQREQKDLLRRAQEGGSGGE